MRRWLLSALGLLILVGVALGLRPRPPEPMEAAPVREPEFKPVEIHAQASQPAYVLKGTVRDGAGHPVAGAQVFIAAASQESLTTLSCGSCGRLLLDDRARENAPFVLGLLAQRKGELTAAASTTTDAQGAFAFEQLAGVSFNVWARASGLGEGIRERAAPGEAVELFLPQPRSLRGQVVDDSGRGVPRAELSVVSRRIPRVISARADGDGRFLADGLGEGPFFVLAAAPGRLPAMLTQVEAGPEPVRLTVLLPRRLEVQLVSEGKPLDGLVRLSGDHVSRELATRDGRTAVDALYPGRLLVSGHAGPLASAPQSVVLTEAVTRVTLELERGGRVLATVLDDEGQPVPNPTVVLTSTSGDVLGQLKAKTGERVVFGPFAAGDYLLRASAEGHGEGQLPVKLEGHDTDLEVVLQRGVTITGRVLDEYGRAAPGISVLINPTGDAVVAGADGKFVAAVPSAGLYELHAHHSDWGGGAVKVTAPAKDVELHLEPRAGAEVTVLAEGRRVEGAQVVLFIEREGSFRSDRPSAADGVVVMRGLPAGSYTLIAAHSDYLTSDRMSVELIEGELKRVSVELKAGAAVTGRVLDEKEQPIANVSVTVSPRGAEPTTTDGLGHFELRPLKPKGSYQVRIAQRGLEQQGRTVAVAGGEPVTVRASRQGIFKGRVLGAGKPLKHFRVEEQDVESSDGRFELPLPSAGERVIFSVEASGYEPEMVDRPSANRDVGDITLERAPEVLGVVRDENGAGVPDAVVGCDVCEQSVLTGPDGHFKLSSPAYMREFVVLAKKGKRTATKRTTVAAGPVELKLGPGLKLSGTAWLPSGQPAGGVEVQGLLADRNEQVTGVTGPDGRFSLDVSPGVWRFGLNGPALGRATSVDPPSWIFDITSELSGIDLGPAPGLPSVTVRVRPERGFGLWLVRGVLPGVGNPPLELLRANFAQFVYQPLGDRVTFGGLAPGRYTVVWASFHAETEAGPVVLPIDVPQQGEVSVIR